jgi:multidrug efflux pump subunit AcrA (membrane-fusion protein)
MADNPNNPEVKNVDGMQPPNSLPNVPLQQGQINVIPQAPIQKPEGPPLSQLLNQPVDPKLLNQQPIQAPPVVANQAELKSAAKQVMLNPAQKPDPAKKPEVNNSKPKGKPAGKGAFNLDLKTIYICAFAFALLIPMPKQVGGEIEIEGTPAASQAMLRPSIGGTVKEVFVKTGEEVKKGQVIAVLRNWELEEKTLEAEKQLARLEASLGPLGEQKKVANEEYQKAKEDFNRQKAESDYIQGQVKGLNENSAPPRIDATRKQYEQIKLQAESLSQKAALHKYLADEGVFPKQSALQSAYEAASAVKQSQALQAQLKAEENELKERSVEDVPKLNESTKAAQANFYRSQSVGKEYNAAITQITSFKKQIDLYHEQIDDLTLKSPIDGRVLSLKTDLLLGQNFNRGDTVATIGNLSRVKVKIQLPEEDRAYTKVGQKVSARFRAVSDEVFVGEVYQIAPITSETGEQTNKRRIWEENVLLNNPKDLLKPGMTGYAKIQTGQWRSLILLAWDEVYKSFRLDRYIDKNPLAGLFPPKN